MVVTTRCCVASIVTVSYDVALQLVAINTLCLYIQNCLSVVAVSVRSVVDSSHFLLLKYELKVLLKASLNLIPDLSEISRYVDLIIHIVDLV